MDKKNKLLGEREGGVAARVRGFAQCRSVVKRAKRWNDGYNISGNGEVENEAKGMREKAMMMVWRWGAAATSGCDNSTRRQR